MSGSKWSGKLLTVGHAHATALVIKHKLCDQKQALQGNFFPSSKHAPFPAANSFRDYLAGLKRE